MNPIEETKLQVSDDLSELHYRFPSCFYDLENLEKILANGSASFQLTEEENGVSELRIKGQNVLGSCLQTFSKLNNLPFFTSSAPFQNSKKPLVSCIILLTANDLFVRTLAIPSLIVNSQGYEIEIIIAYNGPRDSLDEFSGFPVVRTEFGWVAKGYNAGVKMAKGQYVAIFHDDCQMSDPNWIPQCINMLNDEVWAVTPEIRHPSFSYPLTIAKNIPLVMRKDLFAKLGGYDENYYFGCEDVDFTYAILSKGKKIAQVELDIFHGSGMSTIIFISKKAKMYQTLFGVNAFSHDQLSRLQDFYRYKFGTTHAESQAVMAKYRLYCLDKYRDFLTQTVDPVSLDKEYREVTRILDQNKHLPFLHDQTELMKTWKYWTNV